MALQTATNARTTAAAKTPYNYDSECINAIQAEIERAKAIPEFFIEMEFNSDGKNIIESDDSTLDIEEFKQALIDKGYDVSYVVKCPKLILHLRF